MVFLVILLMIALLFLGLPVAFGIAIAGVVGTVLEASWGSLFGIISTVPYRTMANYTWITIPMFVLLAEVVSKANITREVFFAASKWLGRLPGGLGQAAVIGSAAMGAICGSSGAAAATMAKVSIPELTRHGYDRSVAAGIVTVAGTLAIMIPPSITFIIYGILTENSIGKLLIAGIIPGLMTTFMYIFGILFWNKVKPGLIPPPMEGITWNDRWSSLKDIWPFLILAGAILVFLYTGWATPTEASALGALTSVILVLVLKRCDFKDINAAARATIKTSTMMFTIFIGAMIFGYFLTITNVAQNLITYVGDLSVERWVITAIVMLIYLVMGCLMDGSAILFITIPISYPLMMSLGYDPIWFGVIVVKIIEIGLITPPVGLNAYIVSGTADVPLAEVFRGTAMLLVFEVLSLVLLVTFPILSTWLPGKMSI